LYFFALDVAHVIHLVMMKPEFFNAKILLFGEYGMIYNAMALSVPFDKFSGRLDFPASESNVQSTAEIRKFYEYLKANEVNSKLNFPFDLNRLGMDISGGLYFSSTIPQQYGVGSSGALVAALVSEYTVSKSENTLLPELLKADFAVVEGYFHGKSSGIDPLISFLNQPLLIDSEKHIHKVDFDLDESGMSIALINTNTTGATGPLVQHFMEHYQNSEFKYIFDNQFITENNICIESLLKSNKPIFFNALEKLIRFQLDHFRRMIPNDFHSLIREAMDEKVFIKLLGSGGGGFLIAFAESENVMGNWAKKNSVGLLKIV
jgi:mevalonate kinase